MCAHLGVLIAPRNLIVLDKIYRTLSKSVERASDKGLW